MQSLGSQPKRGGKILLPHPEEIQKLMLTYRKMYAAILRYFLPYLIHRAEENTSVAGQTYMELELIRKEISPRKALQPE